MKINLMRNKTTFILFIILSWQGYSQYKYEKELHINVSDVPVNALAFVDSLDFNTKVRWYKEMSYDKISFEAKTRYKGEKHSIEFAENGSFEDLEIEIKANRIPAGVLSGIKEYLNSEFKKFSIQKVQIQYTGDPELILEFFWNKNNMDVIKIHFEIVISTRLDGSFVMFEYLFSQKGDFIHRTQITLKMTDNLEY